jgi:putative DNA methylase
MTIRKKLIEVSVPLEAINAASAREKSIRHGHPSTVHLWWARRPLAACRAVLFSQLVDDPSAWPGRFAGEAAQEAERKRLHAVIAELVKWENSNNEMVLGAARWEIARSVAWGLGEEPPARDDGAAILAICKRRGRRSTIRSAAAGRSRWRRSAWACGPMAQTSTRSRC